MQEQACTHTLPLSLLQAFTPKEGAAAAPATLSQHVSGVWTDTFARREREERRQAKSATGKLVQQTKRGSHALTWKAINWRFLLATGRTGGGSHTRAHEWERERESEGTEESAECERRERE